MRWAEGQEQKQSKAKGMADQEAGGVSSKGDWYEGGLFPGWNSEEERSREEGEAEASEGFVAKRRCSCL